MPLNPPTYQGMDVYYSNNVFVNKVPVALWKPPAGAFNDGSPGTASSAGGVTMYAHNESGTNALYRDQAQVFGSDGFENDDGADPGSATGNGTSRIGSTGPIDTFVGSTPTGPNPNPSAPAPSSRIFDINKLPNNYPSDLGDPLYAQQISQYFTLAAIQRPPLPETQNIAQPLTARDVAANFVDLCQNMLDPIYSKFKFRISSAYRDYAYNCGPKVKSKPISHHRWGSCADITMGSKDKNIEMFKWIVNCGIPFRQVILESSGSTGNYWVHVEYYRGEKKNDEFRVAYFIPATNQQPGGKNGEQLPSFLKP